jgi:tetratricopeptide (TPR) repeat protein
MVNSKNIATAAENLRFQFQSYRNRRLDTQFCVCLIKSFEMKIVSTLLLLFGLIIELSAQFDPFATHLVYHEPGMDKVTVRVKQKFKGLNRDSLLYFNIYYPENIPKSKTLPVVIFNNGVGSLDLPEWQIYKDWGRLIAAHGIIAITHQARNRKANTDFADLIQYLEENASALQIDKNKLGIWVCSGNTPVGWSFANDPKNSAVKAIVVYYGFIPPQERSVRRQDLEIFMARAGLDSYNLNKGMEELMTDALQKDSHIEFVNYPEGQHAFDAFDNTPRSKEIILQTVDFFKRNLLGDNTDATSAIITTRQLWRLVLNEKKTDKAIALFKQANELYRNKPEHTPFFNQFLNENNLNGLGYQLLSENRTDEAIKIFILNTETFPNSPNAFDALSDGYKKVGDKSNTLKNAKLAIEKLANNSDINPQFAKAIRESAESKIRELENPVAENTPQVRAHHELIYDEQNKAVMLTGGSTPLNGGQSFKTFNDVWHFKNSTWTKIGDAGDERSGMRMAYDSKRKKIYSLGGYTGQSRSEFRVLENNDWKIISAIPEMTASEPGFVYDVKRDKLVAFGGSVAPGEVNDATWEWDGQSWKKFVGNSPGGRQAFAMVYDSKRNKIVVFGGMSSAAIGTRPPLLGDTWEFDGKAWAKITESGPGARTSPGFAFDSKRGLLIIFGGIASDGAKNDTWSWDGTMWKKLSENGPPARAMGYMAYDKDRDRIVLFGGRLGWPNDANDTWEWDGNKWMEVKVK